MGLDFAVEHGIMLFVVSFSSVATAASLARSRADDCQSSSIGCRGYVLHCRVQWEPNLRDPATTA
jgi:hypothetical protein